MCCLLARVQKSLPRSLLQPFIVYSLAPCMPRIMCLRALQLEGLAVNISIMHVADIRDCD